MRLKHIFVLMIEHKFLPIDKIELLENNPRIIDDASLKKLCNDIESDPGFLEQRPSLINLKDGRYICYAGQQRIKAQRLLGRKEAPVFIEENVSEEVQNKRMVIDNTHRGEWDIQSLMNDFNFTLDELQDFGIKTTDINFDAPNELSDIEKADAKRNLQDRFLVPPFSILDTRQGYWQDRKRMWSKLGLDSQETREDIELVAKSGQNPAVYELRNKMRAVLGRDPEWDEILAEAKKQGLHIWEGASIFDPVLCEIAYSWFCPQSAIIIDPFAGGSVRGIVAGSLNHSYHGIDLRPDQVEANIRQANEMQIPSVSWYAGDSRTMNELLPQDLKADFIFSCPPYHDLEVYSDDPNDLSNMDYDSFLAVYKEIISHSVARLKENRFACFVVGDIRDKEGFYKSFVPETIKAFEEAGAKFYNEIILVNVAGSLPIRINRQFQGYRKVGKMHQNVLVFYKGDPKAIKQEFGEVAIKAIE